MWWTTKRTSGLFTPMPKATVAHITAISPLLHLECTALLDSSVYPAWYGSALTPAADNASAHCSVSRWLKQYTMAEPRSGLGFASVPMASRTIAHRRSSHSFLAPGFSTTSYRRFGRCIDVENLAHPRICSTSMTSLCTLRVAVAVHARIGTSGNCVLNRPSLR